MTESFENKLNILFERNKYINIGIFVYAALVSMLLLIYMPVIMVRLGRNLIRVRDLLFLLPNSVLSKEIGEFKSIVKKLS